MDAERCRSLIQTCFPSLSVRSIEFLAEGWSSSVWQINDEHVFRFPRRPEICPGLLKEIQLLPVLAPALPLSIPCFEYAWTGGPEYEGVFVGYRWIPGVPMTAEHWAFAGRATNHAASNTITLPTAVAPPATRTEVVTAGRGSCDRLLPARQLGEFLTALHGFPLEQAAAAGIPEGSPAQWREEYRRFYQTVRQRVFPLLEAEKQRRIAAAWEGFVRDNANFCFQPALIHGDLSGEHILFDVGQGGITGVIDWEDAAIGDPAFDFTGLLGDYGPEVAQRVLAAYHGPADPGMLSRACFYAAIGPFHEVLFGLDAGLTQHVATGLEALGETWHPGSSDSPYPMPF